MKKVRIFTDGSARSNPEGPGGYGAVLLYEDSKGEVHRKELSEGFEKTTNNRMELTAAAAALEELRFPCEVELFSDSKYLTDAFNKKWIDSWRKRGWKKADGSAVLNIDLWQRILAAAEGHQVTWIWVKGHHGNPENERCDKLATTAADAVVKS